MLKPLGTDISAGSLVFRFESQIHGAVVPDFRESNPLGFPEQVLTGRIAFLSSNQQRKRRLPVSPNAV